ncbi:MULTISPECIES: AI-2E family transporter [unclassified Novosphingobium]|uniref:AI-2E family transporter n=1 Tax=unclassified Novosphingobium TaxID=2644732 RepID=UPI001815F4EA|nr:MULTISPECIES: AI-2E family transporter [unclassified Novosphingobium]NMN05199.1 putative PurR-regulated permease PerM [Novosphingobium sp. SG919]NMN87494.1 putative PurR-regulated permease PerM [Novosphingobium sp. SG916]
MQAPPQDDAPGTWTSQDGQQATRAQRLTGLVAITLLALAGLWTLRAFLPALGWGVILALSLWPLHAAAAQRWPRGQSLVLPAIFTLLVLLIFVIPLAMVASAVIHDSMAVTQWLAQAHAQGVPVPAFLARLPYGDHLVVLWQQTLATPEAIDRLSHQARGLHFTTGEKILGLVAHRVLLISFMLLTLFFLLRDGARVAHGLRIGTRRAFGEAGVRVVDQAAMAVRGTVNGLIIVGFGEGVLMGVAYGLAGVVHAALLGLLTALLSAIPLGAVAAVVLAAALLGAAGQAAAAVAVLAFGGIVVFVADHFVRPVFIGGATRLPFLWVLLAILGGIETWGLIGLVIGPALIAVLMLLWREWVGAHQGPLNPAAEQPLPE